LHTLNSKGDSNVVTLEIRRRGRVIHWDPLHRTSKTANRAARKIESKGALVVRKSTQIERVLFDDLQVIVGMLVGDSVPGHLVRPTVAMMAAEVVLPA
jgi:hypothetical protein